MRNTLRALAFAAALTPLAALGQSAPATMPAQSVYGRLGIPGDTGPGQAIPLATLQAQLAAAQTANMVYAGPGSGGVALPTFRALVGADLPVPGASSLGGVQSKTCSTSNWFNTLSTSGVLGCSQPSFSDLTGSIAPAQLPNPTASTLGGVKSLTAVTHQFLTSISTAGQPTQAQPACTDLSDATSCNAPRGQLPGETSTGSASAGNVGEYVESIIVSGSATSLVTNTAKTVTSISLTAGDWDVVGIVYFLPGATTNMTSLRSSLSLTTNTEDTTPGRSYSLWFASAGVVTGNGLNISAPIPPYRFSISGTTSVFLIADQAFTVSTLTAYGIIRARRVR